MKRIVLLKLSGEALSRVNGIGIDMEKVEDVAYEVKSLKDTGVSVGIVVGAGNIWRGRDAKKIGMDRVSADQYGNVRYYFKCNGIIINLRVNWCKVACNECYSGWSYS